MAGRCPPRFEPRPYRAPWWLGNAHLQTVTARLLRAVASVEYRRERIDTPDGDFIDLDFAVEPTDGPFVLVLHGLEGCSRSGYVKQACRALAAMGLRTVALNFRSRSGEPNRLPGSYHAGRTDDLRTVLRLLRSRSPGSAMGAVGFSLGGNVLLKYLGETKGPADSYLNAAVAVSVPFDLSRAADCMERGWGKLYGWRFLRLLRRSARAKARLFPDAFDLGAIARAQSVRAFDDAVTAPLHGFRDVAHYYAEASSGGYLREVRVPTLLLHARNDPLIPFDSVPLATIRDNACLQAVLPRGGGHVGFVSAGRSGPRFWAEAEAGRFLAGALGADLAQHPVRSRV
jgi:predicted alpha/beta-fold hydrolase